MLGVLVCLVGGSPKAIGYSIKSMPEGYGFVLICSSESRASIPEISHQTGMTDFEIVTVSNAQDLAGCVDEMDRYVVPLLSRLKGGQDDFNLVVDVTGGTKCMSAALALVSRRWTCIFRYVGGDDRSKGGLGVVKDNREHIFEFANPMDSLGHAAVEDALTLCEKANYGAASAVLKTTAARTADASVKRRLGSLQQLTQLFACWDLFDFRGAVGQIQHLERREPELMMVLRDDTTKHVIDSIPAWNERLGVLRRAEGSKELIEDLLANAKRRQTEKKYDDGVARIYRALEAMAQLQLARNHRIPNTKKVELDRLPAEVREAWIVRARPDGTFMLGLQDAYSLLRAMGDALGKKFEALGLAETKSALQARNSSILAHGFEPVREATLDQLIKAALALAELLGIGEADLFQFPVLQRRAG